jgi:serine protease Do
MKKALSYIATFVLGVAVAVTSMLLIHDSKAEPTPIPEPTPIVIEKEVIKEIPVEVVKEVVKEVEVIRPTDLEKVVKDCKNSCVMIYAYKGDTINQGSGWVYNDYVITAKHVVDDAERIDIFTDDSKNGVAGGIEYIDPTLDVAVLRVARTLPSVTLGDSDALKEGEKLVSITSPEGVQNSIDECLNSGPAYVDTGTYLTISESNMRSGSSGGAVFNYNSELIAMVVIGSGGEHYAIPTRQLRPILEKFK